jgi:hypothetical protein
MKHIGKGMKENNLSKSYRNSTVTYKREINMFGNKGSVMMILQLSYLANKTNKYMHMYWYE